MTGASCVLVLLLVTFSALAVGIVAEAQQLPLSTFPNWDPVLSTIENPSDVAIDRQTHDIFVPYAQGNRVDVLLGGFLPKTTIYTNASSGHTSALLIHRICTLTGVLIYGLFFTEHNAGNLKYLPLPLPANPSTGNVEPTVVTAATGLSKPRWLSQTHRSIELYVPEFDAPYVGHWAVHSPPIGTDGTSSAVPVLTQIRTIGSVGNSFGTAITSDDNLLFASAGTQNIISKATPMLPHSGTPTVTTLTFTNTISYPQKLTLHPAHNSATDFILYVGNTAAGNILEYNSTSATDSILQTLSANAGYRPHGVTLHGNGSIIIPVEDGLKTSCCVDSFDYSTQLAGYMSATCLPTVPVQYPNWDPVSVATENPMDVAIDHQTHDIFVPYANGQRLDVLLGGFFPKTTIYTHATSNLVGVLLMHRICTRSGVLIYGVFFTVQTPGKIKYLPLPLPANPNTANVQPTIVTASSGLSDSCWLTQTHNIIEVYVAENTGPYVSHWSVHSPPIGTDGTPAAVPTLARIRNIAGVGNPQGAAITSDDNVLLVSGVTQNAIYKATPMLPHSATPGATTLTFSNTINRAQQLTLHPAHDSASDFILYVGNRNVGNILEYNSTSATDSILVTVSATNDYLPHGVTIHSNGTLFITAKDGLKTSCCVDSFDPFARLAGYQSAMCLMTAPVSFPNWDPVSSTIENPSDVAIDRQTQDTFVPFFEGKRLDVLLGGFLPKTTIYTNAMTRLTAASLIYRICTGVPIYGLFFTEFDAGNIKYIPLPIPANPSTGSVGPTVVTAASGLASPGWLSQTFNSIEVYVTEYTGAIVSHWAVQSSPGVVALTKIRSIGSVGDPQGTAITSDDNVLLVSAGTQNITYKATPMLPHSGTPTVTTLTFTNTVNDPQKLTLHPAHNSATDFILYIGNTAAGNILEYNSTSATDSVILEVSATAGYRPHGVRVYPNGTLIILAEDEIKTSCCVDSFIPNRPQAACTRTTTRSTSDSVSLSHTNTASPTTLQEASSTATVTRTELHSIAVTPPKTPTFPLVATPTVAATPTPLPMPISASPTPQPTNATDAPTSSTPLSPPTPQPEPTAPATIATAVIVATSTVVYGGTTAAAAAGGGGGGAAELQGVLVIGMSGCSGSTTKSAASGSKTALLPLDLLAGDSLVGMMLGSLVLVLGVFFLHTLAVVVKKYGTADKKASLLLRYPSHSFRVVIIFYQGVAFASLAGMLDKPELLLGELDGGSGGVGTRTSTFLVSLAFMVLLASLPIATGVYLKFRCSARYILYRHVFSNSTGFARTFVYPEGYWTAEDKETRRWAFAYSNLRGQRFWKHALHPFAQALLVPLIVLCGLECKLQAFVFMFLFALIASIIAFMRPFRHGFTNVSRVVMLLLTGVIAGKPVLGYSDEASMFLLVATAGLSVLLTLASVFIMFRERKWRKLEESASVAKSQGGRGSLAGDDESGGDSDDDDGDYVQSRAEQPKAARATAGNKAQAMLEVPQQQQQQQQRSRAAAPTPTTHGTPRNNSNDIDSAEGDPFYAARNGDYWQSLRSDNALLTDPFSANRLLRPAPPQHPPQRPPQQRPQQQQQRRQHVRWNNVRPQPSPHQEYLDPLL